MKRIMIFLFVFLFAASLNADEVTAIFHSQRVVAIPYEEMTSEDRRFYLICAYKYNSESFEFKLELNTQQYMNVAVYRQAGCASEMKIELRHEILGSTSSFSRSEVEVIRDVQAGGLRVRQSRRNGCDFIELHGVIDADAVDVLNVVIPSIEKCRNASGVPLSIMVYMSSNGGYLVDGMRLGNVFRNNSVTTVVTHGQSCSSACAIAFLGGKFRTVNGDGSLMFHAPYQVDAQGFRCAGAQPMRRLRSYYNSMLDRSAANITYERSSRYCNPAGGWVVNSAAAEVFGITTR